MAKGYVYVLVNSSMPGLVKVGKTTRLPSERGQELSRATGVATPFVVAFEELCSDCDAIEFAVHAELEARGFRQATNREFFRAPPSDVIRIVLNVVEKAKSSLSEEYVGNENGSSPSSWADLMAEADALYEGDGDNLQDVSEAIRVYKLAAKMGSPEACRSLGSIYFFGAEVHEDHREALEWFKEGAKRGGFDCYLWMARIFCRQQHFENALKSFRKFFDERARWLSSCPSGNDSHTWEIEQYLHMCLDYRLPIEFPEPVDKARDRILSRVVPRLTDQLSPQEREELTRVRDVLLATMSGANQWKTAYSCTYVAQGWPGSLSGVVPQE